MGKKTTVCGLTEHGECLLARLKEKRKEREEREKQGETVVEIPWYAIYMDGYEG